jgi:multiple antibiotic resistance protein
MTRDLELLTVFVIQLFIIVDPLAGIPIFLAITPGKTKIERRAMARRSCVIAFLIIVFFLVAGSSILGYFGIKTSAVRICGGILLFIISLELLHGRATGTETSSREERLAEEKEDVSVTPLAIPLLAGPGAIATTLVFAGQADSTLSIATLVAGAAMVFIVVYLFLYWADELARVIGALGMKIVTRIMGLLLAFIAVQYVIDGVQVLFGFGQPFR